MRPGRIAGCCLAAALLAGCGTPGGQWAKPGADADATAAAYRQCRVAVEPSVRNDVAIDQDILATRQSDWQRAGVVRQQTQTMQEDTRERAEAIIAACMQAKGFVRAR